MYASFVYQAWHTHACVLRLCACVCIIVPCPTLVGSGDGLVPLAMEQELVKLGQLWFKPQNTKKLGKEKKLEGWEGVRLSLLPLLSAAPPAPGSVPSLPQSRACISPGHLSIPGIPPQRAASINEVGPHPGSNSSGSGGSRLPDSPAPEENAPVTRHFVNQRCWVTQHRSHPL